jgi:hypothetical protein
MADKILGKRFYRRDKKYLTGKDCFELLNSMAQNPSITLPMFKKPVDIMFNGKIMEVRSMTVGTQGRVTLIAEEE